MIPIVVVVEEHGSRSSVRCREASSLGRLHKGTVRLSEVKEVTPIGRQEEIPSPVAVDVSAGGSVERKAVVLLRAEAWGAVGNSGCGRHRGENGGITLGNGEGIQIPRAELPLSTLLDDLGITPSLEADPPATSLYSGHVDIELDPTPALASPTLKLRSLDLPNG